MKPRILDHIAVLTKKSYVKDEEEAGPGWLDCALGVNPYGTSSLVRQALERLQEPDVSGYPEHSYPSLRRRIARFWSEVAPIDPAEVIIGNGSMGILNLVNKILIDRSTRILGYCPQFTEYISNAESYGGSYGYLPLDPAANLKFDSDAFLRQVTCNYHLIYLDNPNNPTGQVIPLAALREIVQRAERLDICVVLDEAYGDFIAKSESGLPLVKEFKNLFVVRSFSKGFGLAGLRVGYMVCGPELQDCYRKVDIPFSITAFSHQAALLALDDLDFVQTSAHRIALAKKKFIDSLTRLRVAETSPRVPIMALQAPDPAVDLHRLLLGHRVRTESGADFINLGSSFVRLRIPRDLEALISAVRAAESELP